MADSPGTPPGPAKGGTALQPILMIAAVAGGACAVLPLWGVGIVAVVALVLVAAVMLTSKPQAAPVNEQDAASDSKGAAEVDKKAASEAEVSYPEPLVRGRQPGQVVFWL